MIVENYWKYFLVPLIVYCITYVIYLWRDYKKKRSYNVLRREEKKVFDDSDVEEHQEELLPALPEHLEHIPLKFEILPTDIMIKNSRDFFERMNKRRSIRSFSTKSFPKEIIYNIIRTGGTAPSGAHTEPWIFVVVELMNMKEQIREIIEAEEEINYKKRMGKTWTTDLKPLKTNWIKEYLTDAPYIILVFKQAHSYKSDGNKKVHYYNEQSLSIAVGFILAAIHSAGLYSLTSTPLNCGPAIRNLLNRPPSEKLVFLLPVGYPAENCLVPDLHRKPLNEIIVEY